MPQLARRPGRHTTRRLEQPRSLAIAKQPPGPAAEALAEAHNVAVRTYGSDSAGYHAFDPATRLSAGVWDGAGGFPRAAVVTALSWGRIDAGIAQRILEGDQVDTRPDRDRAADDRHEQQIRALDAGQPQAARNFPKGQ